jgi:hypothetical protein
VEQRLGQLAPATASAASAPAVPAPSPARSPPAPSGLPLGSTAPAFELPDLNGERHSLADFRGQKLLLLFFNPRCGFCTRIAPDLANGPWRRVRSSGTGWPPGHRRPPSPFPNWRGTSCRWRSIGAERCCWSSPRPL